MMICSERDVFRGMANMRCSLSLSLWIYFCFLKQIVHFDSYTSDPDLKQGLCHDDPLIQADEST